MIKEELVEIVAAAHDLPKTKAADIIRTILNTVQDRVVSGERVTFVGFGTFEAVETKARTGHNPRTREKVEIAATRRPKFTAGRAFKQAVVAGHEATPGTGEDA
jgi:nucleoid DNA-binding protein